VCQFDKLAKLPTAQFFSSKLLLQSAHQFPALENRHPGAYLESSPLRVLFVMLKQAQRMSIELGLSVEPGVERLATQQVFAWVYGGSRGQVHTKQ
jgi:hypothetical protein